MEAINDLDYKVPKWFAVYTKYKCEKYVAKRLQKKLIEVYLPLLDKTKVYTSKTKKYKVPLISCFVFVKITKAEYVKVLETEYVLSFLKQRRDLISIPNDEINLLRRLVGEYETSLWTEKVDWAIGQKLEVIAGQLTGLKGVLVEKSNKSEFIVELKNIGIHLRVHINKAHLLPLV